MKDFLLKVGPVMLGGALGSGARFFICHFSERCLDVCEKHCWLGTLFVNFTGCFVIGLLSRVWQCDFSCDAPDVWRSAVFAGLLGGYTTFSAFSLQVMDLFSHGHLVQGTTLAFSTLGVCLAATSLGVWAAGFFN
jgi:CrcB protein